MLISLGNLLFEQTIQLSDMDDSIELSDLSEDIEEELEIEDNVLIKQNTKPSGSEISSNRIFPILQNEFFRLNYHIKIPVPPPELV